MAAKEEKEEKTPSKLVLFNHSGNPFELGKNEDGSRRIFKVGTSMECKDKAEYDMLRNYKGVGTTQQLAPSLQAHVLKLEAEKKELLEERDALQAQLEKFQEHKKGK